MAKVKPIVTYEFGTFYKKGDQHREGDTQLSETTFNNLWSFILSDKSTSDSDFVMSVNTRAGKQIIRTGRYVGTIQTKDGQTIEILPKIYKASGKQEKDENTCRKVFLNMLSHFTDAKARSFQNASLVTKKNFPILEVYISNYIQAVESLIISGIKKDYVEANEKLNYLKGSLCISQQLIQNIINKTKFAVRYSKYIENIPQNRLIVTTIQKLYEISHNTTNKSSISYLLGIMSDIPYSDNIEDDLRISKTSNRLFESYDMLLKWSSQFLLNKGFTTFSGDTINQSLLFQAEKIFEDFVAYLFKKYAPNYNYGSETQNKRYFLVDRHNGRKLFQMRPDIVVEKNPDDPDYECIIIDTKWKTIDTQRPDKNYLLDIKDMYQLYAYGNKYKYGESISRNISIIPKLVLLYPYSEHFNEELPEFIYDDFTDGSGLKLLAIPFDLSERNTYQAQIEGIIRKASKL